MPPLSLLKLVIKKMAAIRAPSISCFLPPPLTILDPMLWIHYRSSLSVRCHGSRNIGGGQKQEMVAAAFGDHLFCDYSLQDKGGGGGCGTLAPPPAVVATTIGTTGLAYLCCVIIVVQIEVDCVRSLSLL